MAAIQPAAVARTGAAVLPLKEPDADGHEVHLLRRETVAAGTVAFHFTRPPGYAYRAGQSALLTLVDPPETDAEGDTREFTIASAPHEAELMFAMRSRNTAFKRVLEAAAPGTTLRLGEADGDLVLHEDGARPAVFIAGGIGITPFLAMARQAAHDALPHALYLFYANHTPAEAAFLPELRALQRANPRLRLIATVTEPERSAAPWPGERGPIGPELLQRHIAALSEPVYYLAGPPAMTLAMLDMLEDLGVDPGAIQSDEFDGY
ncbi:MAG: FAD-dependent oxidoreductase [Burkholderiaceae bacterium]|nr:MAG: FAD-dependent oxidoreductase [Burkholderiaceae bacterium]